MNNRGAMKPGARASLVVVALALAGSVLLLRSIKPATIEPTAMIAQVPSAQGPSSYTVTLVNDSYYDAEFETFGLGDYTNTVRSLGIINAQDSSEITLTVGAGRYVFALTGTSKPYPAKMNSIMTEVRLLELDNAFRFLQDNMSLAALDASELPSGFTETSALATAGPAGPPFATETPNYDPTGTPDMTPHSHPPLRVFPTRNPLTPTATRVSIDATLPPFPTPDGGW